MEIKAIETIYNGYRFRSRLEARWAVFFDAAGIKYEYEPQGFVLSDGTCYLPDFFLPDFQVYAEVKPCLTGVNNKNEIYVKTETKLYMFLYEVAPIILLRGNPWDNIWNQIFIWNANDEDGKEGCDAFGRFIDIQSCPDRVDAIFMTNDTRLSSVNYIDREFLIESKKVCSLSMVMKYYPDYACGVLLNELYEFYDPQSNDQLTKARLKAQQARFEHGEMG